MRELIMSKNQKILQTTTRKFMRKVIINENQRGLLFKNGKFVRLLYAGKYRLFGENIAEVLSTDGELYSARCSLETLLRSKEIAR